MVLFANYNICTEFLKDEILNLLETNPFDADLFTAWKKVYNEEFQSRKDIPMILDFNSQEDMILAFQNGIKSTDVYSMVSLIKNDSNHNYTTLFEITDDWWELMSVNELKKHITAKIDIIMYNIIFKPYIPEYGALYKKFVVPILNRDE
jgi:hypothetical protein